MTGGFWTCTKCGRRKPNDLTHCSCGKTKAIGTDASAAGDVPVPDNVSGRILRARRGRYQRKPRLGGAA